MSWCYSLIQIRRTDKPNQTENDRGIALRYAQKCLHKCKKTKEVTCYLKEEAEVCEKNKQQQRRYQNLSVETEML